MSRPMPVFFRCFYSDTILVNCFGQIAGGAILEIWKRTRNISKWCSRIRLRSTGIFLFSFDVVINFINSSRLREIWQFAVYFSRLPLSWHYYIYFFFTCQIIANAWFTIPPLFINCVLYVLIHIILFYFFLWIETTFFHNIEKYLFTIYGC